MEQSEVNFLEERIGVASYWLVSVKSKDRQTGEIVTGNFWTGEYNESFSIRGETRLFFGAGSLLEVPPIPQEVGLRVHYLTVSLSTDVRIQEAILGYDPSLQPAEVFRATFDPRTMVLVAEPELIFAGTVDGTPMDDVEGVTSLRIASKVRNLTKTLPIYKSDASLRARAPSDGLRKYVSEAAAWNVPWGTRTVSKT